MNLKKALNRRAINLELKSSTKETVLEELVDLLVSSGMIEERGSVVTAVLNRESKMSTGMQHGIAIPHGKSDTVDSLVCAVGLCRSGIDFDSIDGESCKIFILTVSPINRTGPHIQFLAEISRLLNEEHVRNQLLHASSEEEVVRILTG